MTSNLVVFDFTSIHARCGKIRHEIPAVGYSYSDDVADLVAEAEKTVNISSDDVTIVSFGRRAVYAAHFGGSEYDRPDISWDDIRSTLHRLEKTMRALGLIVVRAYEDAMWPPEFWWGAALPEKNPLVAG